MHRAIFTESFRIIAGRLFIIIPLFLLAALGQSERGTPEDMKISYFVSPEYPPLARQAMQSGDVVLTVTVDTSGRPTDIDVKAPYVLLGESAKQTVSNWRFVPPSSTSKKHVFFHYGFSATPRECNPRTVVAVDMQDPRLIVTVDPRPPFGSDAFPASASPAKKP
jgi:TonB family protein